MEIALLVLVFVLHLIGIAGAIIPGIPGPLVNVGALWLHSYTKYGDFSSKFLLIWLGIALAVLVIDMVVPIWGTKKFGGSKQGVWGATIGVFVGIFIFPPWGIILGPFFGAFLVEFARGQTGAKAFRAGLGSLVGFMLGTGIKLIASFVMLYYSLVAVW